MEPLPISDTPSTASPSRTLVFFDMETTLDVCGQPDPQQCDIIQLAAISGGYNFNVYMMPGVLINMHTEVHTGFEERNGKLFQHDKAIPTVTLYEAMTAFISFLRSFGQPVLLGAHNAKCFHKQVLDMALFRCCLTQQFQQLGASFLDTLLLSKALRPGLSSYEQGALTYPFHGKPDDSHNAMITVTALQQLFSRWTPDQESVAQSLI